VGTVALEGIEFFAYHGVLDEEQKIGNKFSIDIVITTDFLEAAQTDKLSGTVNYEEVYRIISQVMQTRARLLEHIALKIIQNIRQVYSNVDKIEVSVSKFNPPVGGVCARSKITLEG
jgi:7,8-dihydroneopterin aldolase/epimerase/oxygenase